MLSPIYSPHQFDQTLAHLTKTCLLSHGPLVSHLIAWASNSPLGCLSRARTLFQSTAMDDPHLCSTMIRAFSASVFPLEALRIFDRTQRLGLASDAPTLAFALRACAKALKLADGEFGSGILEKGLEIHCRALKLGFGRDWFVGESLVVMYCQCGRVGVARKVFDEMSERRIGAWNAMVCGYDRVGDFESADRLFGTMTVRNVVSWNIRLSRFVRLMRVDEAMRLFEAMPERDSVSWNVVISGCVRVKDYEGALRLFREMGVANVEATEVTLVSVLGACAETGSLEIGRRIHERLKGKRARIEGFLGNALVDMYAKCGKLNHAREVFDELRIRPVSCWNAMIVGLAVHGYSKEALDLFSAMGKSRDNVRPNRVTFIGVLTACSHKGLVEEGRRYFNLMTEHYQIKPDEKHYGCVVDLLSRWGFLNEAYEIIETVPQRTSPVLWRTLLGACAVHRNVELAEKAFLRLTNSEPLKDADYVLLSNVYAEAGRWDDVERTRTGMVGTGVRKLLGSSHYTENYE